MGVIETVGFDIDHFPKQGKALGARVKVCFRYQAQHMINGVCVRDDIEEPFRTIFRLEDGRYIEASECQYTY